MPGTWCGRRSRRSTPQVPASADGVPLDQAQRHRLGSGVPADGCASRGRRAGYAEEGVISFRRVHCRVKHPCLAVPRFGESVNWSCFRKVHPNGSARMCRAAPYSGQRGVKLSFRMRNGLDRPDFPVPAFRQGVIQRCQVAVSAGSRAAYPGRAGNPEELAGVTGDLLCRSN